MSKQRNENTTKDKYAKRNRSTTRLVIKIIVWVVAIILQAVLWLLAYGMTQSILPYWKTASLLVSGVVVLYIVNNKDNPAYKLAWVILVLVAPLVGGFLYISLAGNRTRKHFVRQVQENRLDTLQYMPEDAEVQRELQQRSHGAGVQAAYISQTAGYSVYKNTTVKYFPLGEYNYAELLRCLKDARHFIFMEYFIIKDGFMWQGILDTLKDRALAGVDVRLIYDDFGCALGISTHFEQEMATYGIRAIPFNRMGPMINLRQNNRDHRKITVVDGYIGFTGGINLADEYVNRKKRFGHWKDTGIMLRGDAVWNLTLMFLQTWQFLTGELEDYRVYVPAAYNTDASVSDGFVQPYGATPVDEELVGEYVYLNMINRAKRYIYITTPYLILDNEMITALTLAAKSGIDVRIITPGIPDKPLVYLVSQSYYFQLIEGGVRIYQYIPGFVHAKTVIVDDCIATVGTVNFDYRSFYLHFECGVWMFGSRVIYDIKKDFIDTLEKCEEVTMEAIQQRTAVKRFGQSMLRLIAPLM